MSNCINSSKVYCKWGFCSSIFASSFVLIVAKCIVNNSRHFSVHYSMKVLIVAKCIVNYIKRIAVAGMTMVLIVAKCIVNFAKCY